MGLEILTGFPQDLFTEGLRIVYGFVQDFGGAAFVYFTDLYRI